MGKAGHSNMRAYSHSSTTLRCSKQPMQYQCEEQGGHIASGGCVTPHTTTQHNKATWHCTMREGGESLRAYGAPNAGRFAGGRMSCAHCSAVTFSSLSSFASTAVAASAVLASAVAASVVPASDVKALSVSSPVAAAGLTSVVVPSVVVPASSSAAAVSRGGDAGGCATRESVTRRDSMSLRFLGKAGWQTYCSYLQHACPMLSVASRPLQARVWLAQLHASAIHSAVSV